MCYAFKFTIFSSNIQIALQVTMKLRKIIMFNVAQFSPKARPLTRGTATHVHAKQAILSGLPTFFFLQAY